MTRKPINTVTSIGNETRIDDNFIELYAALTATATPSALLTSSANFTATASAATLIATGEVRGASANFSATCSASALVCSTINGAAIDNLAWTTYTPSVSAGVGTITTKSATGRYKQIGKTVFVQIAITITTNGSGSSDVIATPPFNAGSICVISGRENAVTGKMLQGIIIGSSVSIFNYDNTYPGVDGAVLQLSGVYESA